MAVDIVLNGVSFGCELALISSTRPEGILVDGGAVPGRISNARQFESRPLARPGPFGSVHFGH